MNPTEAEIQTDSGPPETDLRELAALFLRLGCMAFGGPVAHIAMMEDEVVVRRKWMTRADFLDLVGATNLLPGPNSTEMALHIGQVRGGWRGLLLAGFCFISPAVLMMLGLAMLYTRYGALPQARWLLFGVQPVVVAIVVQALWKFAPAAVTSRWTALIALCAGGLALCGEARLVPINEVTVIFLAAFVGLIAGVRQKRKMQGASLEQPTTPEEPEEQSEHGTRMPMWLMGAAPATLLVPSAAGLFWIFLKIGSILYGSGYVLLAFLRADFVERLHWLTDRQLLDAVALGQMTPGPLFTTSTFVGYQIAGVGGAIAATAGIFLPSFVFVSLMSVALEKLRKSPVMRSFLDAVNAASFALMVVVCLQLGRFAIWNPWPNVVPVILFAVSLILLLRTRLNSVWLLVGGMAVGLLMFRLQLV